MDHQPPPRLAGYELVGSDLRTRMALVLVLPFVLWSCTAHAVQPQAPSQPASIVSLNVSGGIAGFDRELELSANGVVSVTDRRRKLTRSVTLTPGEVTEIRSLFAGVQPGDAKSPDCRDCIAYVLTLKNQADPIVVRADDLGLDRTTAAPLVRRLSQLLNRTLTGAPQ